MGGEGFGFVVLVQFVSGIGINLISKANPLFFPIELQE